MNNDPPKQYVFSSKQTIRYRFPTHSNELIMDRHDAKTSEAFLVILDPGEATPPHVHDDTEQIFYVLRGAGELRIGSPEDRRFPVSPGDLMRIPPGTIHRVRCEGTEPLVYLSVDCFLNGRPQNEPTWDSHVHVVCDKNGWDFEKVRGG